MLTHRQLADTMSVTVAASIGFWVLAAPWLEAFNVQCR